jgi:hypothetical protein
MKIPKYITVLLCSTLVPVLAFTQSGVTISGLTREMKNRTALPYVNIVLRVKADSSFAAGNHH